MGRPNQAPPQIAIDATLDFTDLPTPRPLPDLPEVLPEQDAAEPSAPDLPSVPDEADVGFDLPAARLPDLFDGGEG